MARILIAVGVLVAAAGVLLWLGVPIGRLPGDVVVRRGAFSFHFPLTTAVIISVVVTLLFAWLRR